MYEPGEIKSWNPGKDAAREITLEILVRHRDSLKQVRTGELIGVPIEDLKDNDRKMNQARGLNLVVEAQREMINTSRSQILHGAMQKWKKKYKDEKEREENPFEKEENDYNTLMKWYNFLISCGRSIREADKSKTLDDDFMVTKVDNNSGEKINELTKNFYDMVEDLETSFEQINLLMIKNKIVGAGIEEDEELTYKEKETEMKRRVEEA